MNFSVQRSPSALALRVMTFAAACMLMTLTRGESPAATSWHQFRGPTGQGLAQDSTAPISFGLKKGMLWQTPIPGKGWSSPVVANNRIWLTTAITTEATPEQRQQRLAGDKMASMKDVAGSIKLYAVCIDATTGSMLHNLLLQVVDEPEPIHPLNSYASPTPVIDENRVYCHFGSYGTWCLDASTGETIWNQRLVIDHSVGPGGSPIIANDHLLLVCDGIDVQFVAALNKQTGEEVWRTPRPAMRATDGEFRKAYSTPLLITVNGISQAVIPGAQWIVAYEPATGKEIWRADHGNGFSISTTPVYTGTDQQVGLIVFTTGYGQSEIVAVRPDGKGDVTLSHIQWRIDRNAPEKPSPLFTDGRVYLIDDIGIFSCVQANDATVLFRKRVPGNYSASPLLVGQTIYLSNQEGVVTLLKSSDKFEEIGTVPLDGRLMASPAVIGNDLIFRSEASLMRFTASSENQSQQ